MPTRRPVRRWSTRIVRVPLSPAGARRAGAGGGPLRGRPDADIAGARADDLDEAAGLDARADAAEVGVEGADGDSDPGAKAELLGPFFRQTAGGNVGGVGLLVEAVAKLAQARVELGQERL